MRTADYDRVMHGTGLMHVLCILFLLSVAFPYTQFLPLETYTQPYPVLLALLVVLGSAGSVLCLLPQRDFLALFGLLCLGLNIFLLTCFPYTNVQELKYLLNYAAPLLLTAALLVTVHRFPRSSLYVLSLAVVAWFVVALVQTFGDPTFMAMSVGSWSEVAEDVVASGRGVLGLAPEPTHHGFHLLLLAASLALLRAHWVLVLLCIVDVVLLARSASAVLALALGGCLFALLYSRALALALVAVVGALPWLLGLLQEWAPEDSRILMLAAGFLENPAELLLLDQSVNARIGGALATFIHSYESFLLPQGMSHQAWLESGQVLLNRFNWLLDISTVGPPSGFGVIVYQSGFLGALLLVQPIARIVRAPVRGINKILVLSTPFVFLAQYYISAAGFALLYACLIYRSQAERETASDLRYVSTSVPSTAAQRCVTRR